MKDAKDLVQPPGFDFLLKSLWRFCCQLYYAQEGETPMAIDIMRLGSLKGSCTVKYQTVDASALAGREYESSSGQLIFENGEGAKEIFIASFSKRTLKENVGR